MNPFIEIYTKGYCPYCVRAKHLLDAKAISYSEYHLEQNALLVEEMIGRSGRKTVPQIFINNKHIGGCDDLYSLEQQGLLDPLLK